MKVRKRKARTTSGAAALKKRLARLERQILDLAELHDAVMAGVNEGVYDWNVDKNTIRYSARVQEAVGLPSELLNSISDWRSRIHPDDLPRYTQGFIDHFKGKSARYECDYRYRALDGSWRWARQHGVGLRRANGKVYRVVGSTGDITALKQAEERYAVATSAAVEGIYEWDLESGSLYLTDRAKAFFGIDAVGQLTPAAWNTRVHGEDYPGYRAALVEHFKGRATQLEHEYRIADGRGGYKWVLDRGIGLRNDKGRVVKLMGALSDVTARKRAEFEQTATAEVLRVMAASPTDVQPVFDAIVRNAVRLCEGAHGSLFRYDGTLQHFVAYESVDTRTVELLRQRYPRPPHPGTASGRSLLERRVINVEDVPGDARFADSGLLFKQAGYRAALAVPMLKDGEPVGAIFVVRRESRPFSAKQIELLRTFADQAVIAIENVRLFNETREALEQQTASADILKAISGSPTDTRPVFEAIVQSGLRLFPDAAVLVRLAQGDKVPLVAIAHQDPAQVQQWRKRAPVPLSRAYLQGRAILDRRAIDVPDAAKYPDPEAEPGIRNFLASGYRAVTIMPMLRGDTAIGTVGVARVQPGALSERQVVLLRTFADEAVIAIENVRLFNETREALQQQTAVANVLKTMSRTSFDLQAVFEVMVDNAIKLCRADFGYVFRRDGEVFRMVAGTGGKPELSEYERTHPTAISSKTLIGRVALRRALVHIPDLFTDSDYDWPSNIEHGVHTVAAVPILSAGEVIGAIGAGRFKV